MTREHPNQREEGPIADCERSGENNQFHLSALKEDGFVSLGVHYSSSVECGDITFIRSSGQREQMVIVNGQ